MKYSMAGPFADGVAPVCNERSLWGYVDKSGKEVIGFKYGYAESYSEGMARVNKNGKWMVIDKSGHEKSEE
jgi:hypothetical protein